MGGKIVPLTDFQKTVLHILSQNRNPESYVAGGILLNQAVDTPRFSDDVVVFHDLAESVASSARVDALALTTLGYSVEWTSQEPFIYRAVIQKSGHILRLDWLFDSAFRFFPIERNPETGFCLNFWDAAVNKVLALAGRSEPRDFVDTVYLHQKGFSLGTLCWAAAGKDPGMTPELVLGETSRNARFNQEQIDSLQLSTPLSIQSLKQTWIEARHQAEALIQNLPLDEVGCLYLEHNGQPVTPDPLNNGFPSLHRHFGAIKGAWPIINRPKMPENLKG